MAEQGALVVAVARVFAVLACPIRPGDNGPSINGAGQGTTMRLPRFRFTLRWLMVAVAIAAVAFGIDRYVERAIELGWEYQAIADSHVRDEKMFKYQAINSRLSIAHDVKPEYPPEYYDRKAKHYTDLRAKYARAARYPWLPVAPDPPEPK